MLKKELFELGLSPSEIKIFLYLLKTGANYANKISFETNINRTNVYEALDRLISKGLVSSITKNNLKWFEAKDPKSLFTLIDLKEDKLIQLKKNLKNNLKNFKVNHDKQGLEANIFVGKKGLRILFDEILETAKPIYLIASQLQFKEVFGPYFELWHKKRIEKKIKQKSIVAKKLKKDMKKRPLLEYKFVSELINPTTTIIYGDNCLFIQWSDEPIAIKIQNKDITRSHLNHFKLLWEQK